MLRKQNKNKLKKELAFILLSAIREFRTAIKEHKGYWKFKIVRERQMQ